MKEIKPILVTKTVLNSTKKDNQLQTYLKKIALIEDSLTYP